MGGCHRPQAHQECHQLQLDLKAAAELAFAVAADAVDVATVVAHAVAVAAVTNAT